MVYKNLDDLIYASSSSRRFFLSLPVKTQMALHSQSEFIKTAQTLHRNAYALENYQHHVELSKRLGNEV